MAVWSEPYLTDVKTNYGRIDPEYYKPEYIDVDRLLYKLRVVRLKNISRKIDVGFVGSMVQHYRSNGVPLIQTQQVNEFFLDMTDCVKITFNFHKKLKKSQVAKGDILIARSGSFGKASIYLEDEIVNSADIIIIDIEESIIQKGYLLSFLNSKYGSSQLIRFASGGLQGHVNLKILEDFKIPVIPKEQQNHLTELILNSYQLLKKSKYSYAQAQQFLEQELGLADLKFEKSVGYETNFSEVMGKKRIDAQCYKPEYVNYELYLRENCKFELLRSLLSSTLKGKQMLILASGVVIPYASIKDIKSTELITDSYCALNSETRIAQKKDLLLAITGATIGKIGLINRYDNLAFSGDLLALKTNENIDPYYLLVVMQSYIGQSQCQRWITGSTNGHLSPIDVGKFVVPRLSDSSEHKIAEYVRSSLEAKFESEQLLELAKRYVEEQIEQAVES